MKFFVIHSYRGLFDKKKLNITNETNVNKVFLTRTRAPKLLTKKKDS